MSNLPKRELEMQISEDAGNIQAEVFAIISTMVALATSISSAIFKDRIHYKPEQENNLLACSRLWSQMLAYQNGREPR